VRGNVVVRVGCGWIHDPSAGSSLIPAEGLDLGHAEQNLHPVLLSSTPLSRAPNPSSQRLLLSRGRS
jgi:hypothetical protein